ncbi:MAG: hypothetical protein JKY17_00540 [Magnetovibrio sp.]|nr:hypothetical protein [Magnetovibrio sp.]
MSKAHFVRKPMPYKKIIPFDHAEEAWFWYVRAERARREGAQGIREYSSEGRPCDPDDMYRFVMHLHKRRILHDGHLHVLGEFGWRNSPPDPRVRDEQRQWVLWDEALDRLSTILISKGIVRADDKHYSQCTSNA